MVQRLVTPMGISPKSWFAVALVVLAAGGNAGSAAPPAIEGRVWRLTRVAGLDGEVLAALREAPNMRLEQGRLQAFGGCNRLAGGYSVDGERLTVAALAGTMMACDDAAMKVEAAFTKALSGTLSFTVAGESLTLAPDSKSEPVLVFAVAPPPQLEGIDWKVTGFNNGRSAVVSPLLDTVLSLRFEDGKLTGNAGCNRFSGTYTRDGSRLSIASPVATTRMQCGDEVMQQEREFLAAVQAAVTWAIDVGMLDMHRADGERALTASRAADQ